MDDGRQMLLNPRSSIEAERRKLKLSVENTEPMKYFTCGDKDCTKLRRRINMFHNNMQCRCRKLLSRAIRIRERETEASSDGGGVFTKHTASFIICDDLQILSNVTRSFEQAFNDLGIIDTDEAELRNVTVGFDELMDLLKGSLLSQTPLTDLILRERKITAEPQPGNLFHELENKASSNTEKMVVKAMVQKSTNKLLYAEAEDDFVDFLFSLLTIPLGRVECLLGSNTALKNIDNCIGALQILSMPSNNQNEDYLAPLHSMGEHYGSKVFDAKSPEDMGKYVKGPRMYRVTDDLIVTPLCTTSTLSILKGLKISFSDVKELELQIGLEEALNILKASLTSTSALTDGLINPLLKKKQKQES